MEKQTIVIDGVEYIKKPSVDEKPYVIIRSKSASPFAGHLISQDGLKTVLQNARRLWWWDGAASLSQLAINGTSKPTECKFPGEVDEVILTETIEVLHCTAEAKRSIQEVPVWKA